MPDAPVCHVGHMPVARCVLVVDDNRDGADSLALLLTMEGCVVHVAYSGRQALELAQTLRPGLVLLDIGLPDLNGHEVCKALRACQPLRTVVIVALSGWRESRDSTALRVTGFDHHLVKPVDFNVLRGLLPGLQPTLQPSLQPTLQR